MNTPEIITCRFTTERETEEHFHSDLEIIYVIEGNADVRVGRETYHLDTEAFLLIGSEMPHAIASGVEVILGHIYINYFMLRDDFGRKLPSLFCLSTEEESERYEILRSYLLQVFHVAGEKPGHGILLRNSIFYQMLFYLLSNFYVKNPVSSNLHSEEKGRNRDILNFLEENYGKPIMLADLAGYLYLSDTYLSRYIRKNFHTTFLKLLSDIRLKHALPDLVRTEKTILRVALDNGFPNVASFSKAFREKYEKSPVEYRNDVLAAAQQTKSTVQEKTSELMERVERYLEENMDAEDKEDSLKPIFLSVDADQREEFSGKPVETLNVGDASSLLQYDVCAQLKYLSEHIGFHYVRFWNLFTEDMMVLFSGKRAVYNFGTIDRIIDFILENGWKPHIELNMKGTGIISRIEETVNESKQIDSLGRLGENLGFFEELIRHWQFRYGKTELKDWRLELENNVDTDGGSDLKLYLDTFEKLAAIAKSYIPEIQMGGAGFALGRQPEVSRQCLELWKKRKIHPDFISVYSYPYRNPVKTEEKDKIESAYFDDRDFLFHRLHVAKQLVKATFGEDMPVYVTEWSFTLSNRNALNDSCFKAAYLIRNMIGNCREKIAYWTAFDLTANYADIHSELFGGCGLLSQQGIPKPSMYSLAFMNSLGNEILGKNENVIVTCNNQNDYLICCHNYKHFNPYYYSVPEDEIDINKIDRYFENQDSKRIRITIHNVVDGIYIVKKNSLNSTWGSVLEKWEELYDTGSLERREVEYLRAVAQPRLEGQKVEAKKNMLTIETELEPHEIQFLKIIHL